MTHITPQTADSIPAQRVGIGLRREHYAQVLAEKPAVGWLEVHNENYLGGGKPTQFLRKIRTDYPVSMHGVGLSLGSAEGLDPDHLEALYALMEEVDPFLISEHLSWSIAEKIYLNDLMPVPYTHESLDIFSRNVEAAQTKFHRQILIENPSSYMAFKDPDYTEWDFLMALQNRTGCGLLLDVNNIWVSAHNHGFAADDFLEAIPVGPVKEIHLAGHHIMPADSGLGLKDTILIDDHGSPVCDGVWDLYAQTLAKHGPVNTLIEWDTDVPSLDILLDEAEKARTIMAAQVEALTQVA